ncbi:predicted protein [Naegleria gruberi]|uniref:Splicing factor YJU2 n=1 Tax=Naegleria gruberi TaxID=5762 RepID=D2UYH9_NAEGR|nr:uncharacterized protein NAEGRDRAFT_60157 [Naegleria gruberi]EFC50795.1 predicted protein [Naegleria gruberi]|eukprot:XP_002683539.1 predicted protein [Naegleria gruberi strain NEG-M]
MAERKVIQKYYHPEFDPSQIPRRKVAVTNQVKIRMMLPMTVQCSVCGEFMYQGKKFNSRKETVQGEEYLGLKVFRFYIRCTRCASEVTFKTDPKNSGYVPEHNCVRSFPPKHNGSDEIHDNNEDEDAMKKLESKTLDSKQELEDLDVLDSIKTIKNLQNKISTDHLLEKLQEEKEQEEQTKEEFTQNELEEINDFYKQKRVHLEDEEMMNQKLPLRKK